MSNSITVRIPDDLAEWLDRTARRSGSSRGGIVRAQLEKARTSVEQPFLRLAGKVDGPPNLSTRRGFSAK